MDRLQTDNSVSKLKQFLEILKRDIDALEKQRSNFNLNEKYEKDLEYLNKIRSHLNQETSEIGRLELRRELIQESREDLEKDHANVDTTQIATLYEQAKVLIPNVQKSFKETVDFHNQMIEERVNYITQELPELNKLLDLSKNNVQSLLEEEKIFVERLQKAGAIEDLQEIVGELSKLYEQKGTLEEKLTQLIKSTDRLNSIESDLNIIDKGIYTKDSLIQERVKLFNNYFSAISNNLYGDRKSTRLNSSHTDISRMPSSA